MKMHTARPDLLAVWYLPVIILYSCIVIFLPQYLLYLPKFNSFLLIISLLLIFSPLGNVRFGAKQISFPNFIKKSSIIVLFELGIALLYCGTQIAVLDLSNETLITGHSYILSLFITKDWFHLTLYPWTLYAIVSVVLAWSYHQLKIKPTTLGCGLKSLFNKKFSADVIVSIDFFYRSAFIFFIITTISLLLLMVVYAIAAACHISLIGGLNIKNFLIFVVIQQCIFSKMSNKIFGYLRSTGKSLGFCLFLLAVFFVILFFLFNTITDFLAANFPILQYTTNLPTWIMTLSTRNHYLLIFSWAWLFAMAPGIANYFAKITEGWRVRTIMIAILFLPLMINMMILLMPKYLESVNTTTSALYLRNLSADFYNPYILPIICLGLLLIFFTFMNGVNSLFRLSFNLDSQDERLILTNILRGLIYSTSLLTFGIYIGMTNIILLSDLILILPCVTLVFMSVLAYFKYSLLKKR